MIVVTAAGGSPEDCAIYRRIIEAQARKCEQFCYGHMVYDLGGLGIGERFEVPASDFALQVNGDSLPAATFKAELVQRAWKDALHNELVCWLDADCIPLCGFDPRNGAYPLFDAAVTLRPAPEIGLSNNPALDYLNSGVVWIRNNNAGRDFCESWRAASRIINTDQGALNAAVGVANDRHTWNSWRGRVVKTMHGAGVLVLDCAEWNSWHPPFTGARIAHLKRGIRGQAANYL